mmetsp:Transcript_35197/g.99227  ORF Transcript_35197/g.99227 Transcript_35197/m.99227 type:complete len:179 (+) Transcript_35197:191-727(+)|eukprot:CAMPEP_0119139070 /NCGR_PEP_ID=MMETSP1310-20130426/26827_1 /TAXON_ID=464262 /ORGANISM="Genus nov. species nov., Strain RCC2339" /LENGTH=178 /DNA_ID=CAMNT_0007130327 /DNA_START=90 /DNA_END=626 /DNA_ORIENTATION=+
MSIEAEILLDIVTDNFRALSLTYAIVCLLSSVVYRTIASAANRSPPPLLSILHHAFVVVSCIAVCGLEGPSPLATVKAGLLLRVLSLFRPIWQPTATLRGAVVEWAALLLFRDLFLRNALTPSAVFADAVLTLTETVLLLVSLLSGDQKIGFRVPKVFLFVSLLRPAALLFLATSSFF